ncbi:peptide/nickel transport system permease protein [Nonlabens dokdonensis]|uniref:Oligopeptide transport permeasee n=2 Tax=Nonlabens dokdonensis TaxID=328515 RepID=L7WAB4_NONDD|nr:ABC transporter permease [Nonlabens dokdonensis]AGC77157.1 oligopeptide transport permeasee [Nonlabens dokdonensis DSW-6]PZX41115.1 peptide/nickel transport system permease protein [Nonlabens dokdonensis]
MAHKSTSLSSLALQKFKKNFWGVLSFMIILFYALIAVFAYVIAPDDTKYANQMHISIHSQPPGFTVDLLSIGTDEEEPKFWDWWNGKSSNVEEIPFSEVKLENGSVFYSPFDIDGKELPFIKTRWNVPEGMELSRFRESYTSQKTFLLGTDKYGRDLLSRMIIGTRISISIGFIAVLISLLIGISLGAIAGYYGGKIDAAIMWLINVTWSIPTLLMVIAISIALGKGFLTVFIAVGLTMWVEVARVVRGQMIVAKEYQYVTAAKALGFNSFRIITKHILPNIMAPVIVISAANFAASILIESGLSFLGLGARPPMPSWGSMIKDHYQYIILDKAYLAIVPGIAIMTLVMAFMLLGNALRDALDVKTS